MELKQYYEKLYQAQDRILQLLAKSSCYLYLTGGTALHRFILQGTRYSDDIDLFTADRSVAGKDDMSNFVKFLKNNGVAFDVLTDVPNFKRLIVKENNLKIDIVHDTTEHIGNFNNINGVLVDNVENILANKYDAVLSREQSRDLFDIYTIIKQCDVNLIKSMENLNKKSASEPEIICARIKSFPKEMIDIMDIKVKDSSFLKDFIDNYKTTFDDFFDIKNLSNKPKIHR
ncbi:nucleotidyl transferase AbiEii/AbiGii toxin family protein [Campylobacter sputorum]|uniref:nucleotidyl transferase AbiEii/AbiGii toxin family protein n=1 Tax=Campylobacter sputorum TaxID=206 RepID=UPI00053BF22D|nr:nucleotidyl transferase AbiEii/AbiGii toxin family protein [Campylobacter sputorum]